MITINKTRIYAFTGIAALLYIALTIAFADDLWKLGNLWSSDYVSEGTWLTYVLLAAIIGLGFYQVQRLGDGDVTIGANKDAEVDGQVEDPSLWKLIMGNTWLSVLWLPIRFFVGQEWLVAGEHKIRDSAWMSDGTALQGFLTRAVTVPEGRPSAPAGAYDWYQNFLQYMIDNEWYTWFAKIIAVGEFMVGLGLIVGALVGIAAFFGTVMNFSFMMAGTASSNPVLFGLSVFLVLGWKVAGHLGIDRWLLPILGTPWRRGPIRRQPRDQRQMIHRQHPA
jgi:thiosulfate dehydrogenase [quinone] large subunit